MRERAILVEEPPEFEFRDGMFYASYENGNCWAWRPNTFFQALTRMARVSRDFKCGSGEVIAFPTKVAG